MGYNSVICPALDPDMFVISFKQQSWLETRTSVKDMIPGGRTVHSRRSETLELNAFVEWFARRSVCIITQRARGDDERLCCQGRRL